MKISNLICSFLLILVSTTSFAEPMLKPISGGELPFSSLHGKWVFINYWASWCQPCLNEIPELNSFYDRHKNENIAIFGVNFDAQTVNIQKKLIAEFGLHYPSLGQDPAESLSLGDIRGVPVTFVFDPEGRLRQTLYGEQTAEGLDKLTKNI